MEFLCRALCAPLEFICRRAQVSARLPASSLVDEDQSCAPAVRSRSPIVADRKEQRMLDFILLAVGLAFFALSIAYAFGCDRL
jgi:hypothetical protein